MKKKHLFSFFLFLTLLVAPEVWAQIDETQFNEENERIYLLRLSEGIILNEAFVIYETSQGFFLPLTALTDELGLGLKVSAQIGSVEGFILNEKHSFSLDVRSCKIQSEESEKTTYPCQLTVVRDGEIFIHQDLYRQWFTLTFQFNPLKSEVIVSSSQELPIEARLRRDKEAKTLVAAQKYRPNEPDFPELPMKHKALDGFVLDQQIALKNIYSPTSGHKPSTTQNTRLVGEVLGLESSLLISSDSTGSYDDYMVFAKRDPEGKALGFSSLKAKEVELYDVIFKTVPLVSSPLTGRGISISSYDLKQSNNFGSHDFTGFLPENWEVELYQDDVLIGREAGNNSGRYNFNSIPLLYNTNQFRLTFYGPHGEQYDEFVSFNINRNNLSQGKLDYFLGYSQDDSSHNQYLTQVDYGLTDSLTLRTNFVGFRPKYLDESDTNHFSLYSIYGFKGPFNYSFLQAVDSNGHTASEPNLTYRSNLFNLGATHRQFNNFRSNLYNNQNSLALLKSQQEYALAFITPFFPVRMTVDYLVDQYSDSSPVASVEHTMATYFSGIHFNNRLNMKESGNSHTVNGTAEASLSHPFARGLVAVNYNKEHISKTTFSLRKRLARKYSAEGEWTHFLQEKNENFGLTGSYYFKAFSTSLSLTWDTQGAHSVLGVLSYSFGRDRHNQLHFQNEPQSSAGVIQAQVFRDLNGNGSFDSEDKPLEGARLQVNRQDQKRTSDETGQLYLSKLPVYQKVAVSLSLDGIEDPLLQPSLPGYFVQLRPGKIHEMSFPVVAKSEVDGFVSILKRTGETPANRFKIHLLRKEDKSVIQTSTSDDEGYYYFEKISPGAYFIEVDTDQLNEGGLIANPELLQLQLTPTGEFINDQNFVLKDKKP